MRRVLAATLAFALVTGSVPMTVWAQDDVTKQVEKLSGDAAGAYRDGDYEKSIELFKQAYDLQAVPNLLFNIAKVYEKLEDWDNAIAYYREFIKAPDADSKAREVALTRIDALEDVKAAEDQAAEEKALAEKKKQEDAENKEKKAEEDRRRQEEMAAEDSGGSPLAWGTLVGGATILAGGVVFGLLATSEQSKFEATSDPDAKRSARKSGKTYAVVADSMFIAGAVATTVGIILFATSGSSESAPPEQQATLPFGWVGPNGEAGVGVSLTF